MAHRTGLDPIVIANRILYLAKDRSITPMQLLKLVYISHGWMLGLYGRPLINENALAWKYGPVIPSLYHRFKQYRGNAIDESGDPETDTLDQEQASVVDQVWDNYSEYTGIQLSSLTHKPDTPWDITMRMKGQGSAISNDLIQHHYRALASEQER